MAQFKPVVRTENVDIPKEDGVVIFDQVDKKITVDIGGHREVIVASGGGSIFDVTIRTQAEFVSLYNSPNWLGAVSVAFVGDGGTLEFTRSDGLGLEIPQTVKQIAGFNNAKIKIESFNFSSTNLAGLRYKNLPTTNDYSIRDIDLSIVGGEGSVTAFFCCRNLINCTGTSKSEVLGGFNVGVSTAFQYCYNLVNCTGTSNANIEGHGQAYGFDSCDNLVNCICTKLRCTSAMDGFSRCQHLSNCQCLNPISEASQILGYWFSGFSDCINLKNCTSALVIDNTGEVDGFSRCVSLSNCLAYVENTKPEGYTCSYGFVSCAQLVNCSGRGIANVEGYGFNSCRYLSNCTEFRGDERRSTQGIWCGTNLFRDDDSCQLA